jgi:hypothetical protein
VVWFRNAPLARFCANTCANFSSEVMSTICDPDVGTVPAAGESFDYPCPTAAPTPADPFLLYKMGHECLDGDGTNDDEQPLGTQATVEECRAACLQKGGHDCNYFIFGTGSKAGRCWWEYDSACDSGEFEADEYDIYQRAPDASTNVSTSVAATPVPTSALAAPTAAPTGGPPTVAPPAEVSGTSQLVLGSAFAIGVLLLA